MRAVSSTVVIAIFFWPFCLFAFVAGQSNTKIQELIALHYLDTTVSIRHCYIKQYSLVSVRSYLGKLGLDEQSDNSWQPDAPWWLPTERLRLASIMQEVDRHFSSADGLRPGEVQLDGGIVRPFFGGARA
jgi:hypothetical protein